MTIKLDLTLDEYREAVMEIHRTAREQAPSQSSPVVTAIGWVLLAALALVAIIGSLYLVADRPSRVLPQFLPQLGKFAGGAGAWMLLYVLLLVRNKAIALGRWRGAWLLAPVFVAIVVAGVLDLCYGPEASNRTVLTFLPWYVLGSFGWMYLRRAARDPISVAYEKYTQETGDEEISVTEDGVALTSPLTTSYYRWPAIQRVARSRNVIALVVPNGFVPIPKRALCAEQTAELDLLLANHVERKERAFPVMEPGA